MANHNQVSMDYEAMEKAAQTYSHAAEVYSKIISQLQSGAETLRNCLTGSAGNAAQESSLQAIQSLRQLHARSEKMSRDIRASVEEFRQIIDPSAAQQFQAGSGSNKGLNTLKANTSLGSSELTKAATTSVLGKEYGKKWKSKQPPGLPDAARKASVEGAALPFVNQYAQETAQKRGFSNSFVTITNDIAKSESGTFGRPADGFDNRPKGERPIVYDKNHKPELDEEGNVKHKGRISAWGVFQFNQAEWQKLPGMKNKMMWDATPQQEIELPIQKYADCYGEVKNIHNKISDKEAMRGVFMWQKGPGYFEEYKSNLNRHPATAWENSVQYWKKHSKNSPSWPDGQPPIPASIR